MTVSRIPKTFNSVTREFTKLFVQPVTGFSVLRYKLGKSQNEHITYVGVQTFLYFTDTVIVGNGNHIFTPRTTHNTINSIKL